MDGGRNLKLCSVCGKDVANLKGHKRRAHSQKSWGYLCPCGHFENQFNGVRMRNHIRKHPGVTLDSCIKQISYFELCQCPKCDFQCLRADTLKLHDKETHLIHEYSLFSDKFEDLLEKTENLLRSSNI